MLLSALEIIDLTGYQRPSAQIRWLNSQKIPYLVGGDGRPKVLRAALIARLDGATLAAPKREPRLRL